jgi:large-conductance mechanosensitive channel
LLISIIILGSAIFVSINLINEKPSANQMQMVSIINSENNNQNLSFYRQQLPNLTTEFTQSSLKKLIEDNQKAIVKGVKNPSAFKILPDANDVNKVISEIIDKDLSSEKINISELNINSSNSKETQLAYLAFIDYLLNDLKKANEKNLLNAINQPLPEYFNAIASEIENTVEILKIINVPPSWLEIHKEIIEVLLKQKNIFNSLATAKEDPLRFMIASQRVLITNLEQEFTKIKNNIEQKAKDEKLI